MNVQAHVCAPVYYECVNICLHTRHTHYTDLFRWKVQGTFYNEQVKAVNLERNCFWVHINLRGQH